MEYFSIVPLLIIIGAVTAFVMRIKSDALASNINIMVKYDLPLSFINIEPSRRTYALAADFDGDHGASARLAVETMTAQARKWLPSHPQEGTLFVDSEDTLYLFENNEWHVVHVEGEDFCAIILTVPINGQDVIAYQASGCLSPAELLERTKECIIENELLMPVTHYTLNEDCVVAKLDAEVIYRSSALYGVDKRLSGRIRQDGFIIYIDFPVEDIGPKV